MGLITLVYITFIDYANNIFITKKPDDLTLPTTVGSSTQLPVLLANVLEAGDNVISSHKLVDDVDAIQLVTSIEFAGSPGLMVCTTRTSGREAPIEVDIQPIDIQFDNSVAGIPTTDGLTLTPFETDVSFVCHDTSRRISWNSGTLYPASGSSHKVLAGESNPLVLDRTYHVAYNLQRQIIHVFAHNLFNANRHILKDLGTVRLVSDGSGGYRCEFNLAGAMVTENAVESYVHSNSSTTIVTEHDTLTTPQNQVPTLGNNPNFRVSLMILLIVAGSLYGIHLSMILEMVK